MRMILIAVALLAGCVGEDEPPQDPHELMACQYDWRLPVQQCQAACVTKPPSDGMLCRIQIPDSNVTSCSSGFDFEGVRGCCLPASGDAGGDIMLFAECQP